MNLYYAIYQKDPQATLLITPTGALVDTFALGIPFSAIASDEDNITVGDLHVNVAATGLSWVSSGSATYGIQQKKLRVDVGAVGIAFASEGTADTTNITQKKLNVDVYPTGLPWSSSVIGASNITTTTAFADVSAHGIGWTSEGADTANISQKTLNVDVLSVGLGWSSVGSGVANIPKSTAYVSVYATGLQWSSSGALQRNIPATDVYVDIGSNGIIWTSGAAGTQNIAYKQATVDVASTGIPWSSAGAATQNISAGVPFVNVASTGLAWTSSAADSQGLSNQPATVDVSAIGISWISVFIGAQNISQTTAWVNVYAIGLPFTTSDAPGGDEAVCFDGSIQDPAYAHTNTFGGVYNVTAGFGYISVWYKYTEANQVQDFYFDNCLFTVWGGTEGDRLEFGLTLGVEQEVDPYIKVSDAVETSMIRGELPAAGAAAIDLTDGQWHHLMFGSRGEPNGYYFWVDGNDVNNNQVEYGSPIGQWFPEAQQVGDHELTVGATRISGANNGDLYFHGCIDEMMVVNFRSPYTTDGSQEFDPSYLYNNGDGQLIPQVETDNISLWGDVFNAWQFESATVGDEYVDGIFNFTTWVGKFGTDGINGN